MHTLSSFEQKYFALLADRYLDEHEALAEALILISALELPKPTEHFVSDLHGEYIAFTHVLRNASGVLRRYIDELFPDKSEEARRRLATILYYPDKKLKYLKHTMDEEAYRALLRSTLSDLIVLTGRVAAKYDREQIEEALPNSRKKVLNLLLSEQSSFRHKENYVHTLYKHIVDFGEGERYIKDLADLCVRFAVETVHVIGDIYDRGENAEKIMDLIARDPRIDIQWGNHDIAWIGAASGNVALALNVVRIAVRYNVLRTIEDGYGINLLPLVRYAEKYSAEAPFYPKNPAPDENVNASLAKLHKAVAILQFKAEGQLIAAHPEYDMQNMLHLEHLDLEEKTVRIEGEDYPLLDGDFPTVDPSNPYAFAAEEAEVVERLRLSFLNSERLQHHIRHMVERGSMYLVQNDNLLFHGCIPMTEDGDFQSVDLFGSPLKGRALLDAFDERVRTCFFGEGEAKKDAADLMFYLWCGTYSPLFGKERITTFERYFIDDERTHVERKNPYFSLREREDVALAILESFEIRGERGKIINGHTPVKRRKGESPIKANGRVVVIDGGFAHAYRKTTGTAGYTLISNSYGILLATHEPIRHEDSYIRENIDMTSSLEFVTEYKTRRLARDSDEGKAAKARIDELLTLASLYRSGAIKSDER
ncbi:MAG: fructose-bisphosphatase class III [Peptoniphilus sp.]|nr:fructose-bisphosphatase class III [Peptoniphilus sp.]MDD7363165.1 fructose-bisphosphatase class III [Bacillota bacterium]MDY6044511.1 fructose-bisphosphatase class III [Peptoniphilus sp.]